MFAFVCGNSESNTIKDVNTDEEVETGTGNEISLQLEYDSNSSEAIEVNTDFCNSRK